MNPLEAELVGLSFSVSPQEAFYVPIPNEQQKAQKIVNTFQPLYENEEIEKVGQNIKYDIEVLRKLWYHDERSPLRHHDRSLSSPTRASSQHG